MNQPRIEDVTAAEMIACAEREIVQRERVYPKRVEGGRMTQGQMDRELLRMRAIARFLKRHAPPEPQGELLG